MPDLAEIKRAMRVLIAKDSGRVVELRAVKTAKGTYSGYYSNSLLAQDSYDLSAREDVPNVYWTLQQIDPTLLARRKNEVAPYATVTTSDENVHRYLWLPFDFDPCRIAGVSSTDDEKSSALELATAFRLFLLERGIPTILADSGNGYHLLARIDMPVSPESTALVSAILTAVAKKYSTCLCIGKMPACGKIKIDTKLSNPSHVLKAYGTVARKGSHTAERPWRLSKILDAPPLGVVSEETLRSLLKELGGDAATSEASASLGDWQGATPEMVESKLKEKGIKHGPRLPYKDGLKWQLTECPFNPEHKSPDSFIALERSGLIYFHCSHDSCRDNCKGKEGWKKFKAQVGGFDFYIRAAADSPMPPDIVALTEPRLESSSDYESAKYDMTPEEVTAAEESEDGVYKLQETAGPHFDAVILYGPLGKIAKKVTEKSEAHAGSVYFNLIVSFGNLFGRGPYFNVGATKHYTNENLACIGDSATGRKGTGSDQAERLLSIIASDWMSRCNPGGFGSPQGVLAQIKDESVFQKRKNRSSIFETITVPGVHDKRLCIREGELSNVFKLIADPKTRAGELFRNLWDGKKVSNLVAGKTDDGEHKSLVCSKPHVSIIGYTTPSLAKTTLPFGVDKSGDGNRFIFCYVKRLQLVPSGGPQINWAGEVIEFDGQEVPLVQYLAEAIDEAKKDRLIPIAEAARKFWDSLYLRLESDKRTGFLGGMTSRGPAHIRRLATILALLDRESEVQIKHLRAADGIWDYSQESARYIFVGYSLDQAKILKLAHEMLAEGIGLNDVHNLFNRHKAAAWVKTQMQGLVEAGHLTEDDGVYRFRKW